MKERSERRLIPAPPERIRAVLLNPAGIPDWNPAIITLTGPEQAEVDQPYPVTVRGRLRGQLVYTHIGGEDLTMEIQVPGLAEQGWWRLAPESGGTVVTHGFSHRGPLAVVLSRGFRGVAGLRLDRLTTRTTG